MIWLSRHNQPLKSREEHISPSSFLSGAGKWLIALPIALLVLYFLVYILYQQDGPFPTGAGLSKEDWLSFTGSYLAFGGAVFIGMVAVLQNIHFARVDDQRRRIDRERLIRPVVSVSIIARNAELESKDLGFVGPIRYPGSVTIRVLNAGSHPISNVIVFNRYVHDCALPGVPFDLTFGYEEIPALLNSRRDVIQLNEGDFEQGYYGLPKQFNINYVDVDGEGWFQAFVLHNWGNEMYYSLDGTYRE